MSDALQDALERVRHYRHDPPGAAAYRDSGDAQVDAERLADAYSELLEAAREAVEIWREPGLHDPEEFEGAMARLRELAPLPPAPPVDYDPERDPF